PRIGVSKISLCLVGGQDGRRGLACRAVFALFLSFFCLLLFCSLLLGLFLKGTHRLFDLLKASLTPFELIGQVPALLTFSVFFVFFLVHSFGVFEKLIDLFFKLLFFLFHLPVAHSLVLGGIGFDLCPIESYVA